MFSNPFPDAFGLDIGDLSIKLVQLKNKTLFHKEPTFEIQNIRSIQLPPGLIVNGELQKPEEVRQRILHLLRGTKTQPRIKSPWVVSVLPEGKSFLKLIKINKPMEEILEDDIMTTAKKHIPFENPEEYYFQWQQINEDTNSSEILVGAIPKTLADTYTYLLESAGLGVVALELEPIAITRSMITASKDYTGEARAVLDIGATRSSMIVYDHDVLQFSTSLSFSSELITTALSQRLHISYEEAEEIKKINGLNYEKNKEKIYTIITDMAGELVKQIESAIHFYYSHFENTNKISRIILCGGGAKMDKLDKFLSARLKILTRNGRPWKNLNSKKIKNVDENPEYATAIGLALRAADNPFFTDKLV